jgi:hypothetical protein
VLTDTVEGYMAIVWEVEKFVTKNALRDVWSSCQQLSATPACTGPEHLTLELVELLGAVVRAKPVPTTRYVSLVAILT